MSSWICPKCWWEKLDYGGLEIVSEACYYPRTCKDCGARWEEWYNMSYEWHYNLLDEDWNELLLDNQKEDIGD